MVFHGKKKQLLLLTVQAVAQMLSLQLIVLLQNAAEGLYVYFATHNIKKTCTEGLHFNKSIIFIASLRTFLRET